jgi:hypothetical protein
MPRGIYEHKTKQQRLDAQSQHISEVRKGAAEKRWDSVQQQREEWLAPFTDLPTERALRYLEDLRSICERGGYILNQRINSTEHITCGWKGCKRDLTGLGPNGMPKYIAVKWVKDPDNPQLSRNIYFCSQLCEQHWVREGGGARGTDGK